MSRQYSEGGQPFQNDNDFLGRLQMSRSALSPQSSAAFDELSIASNQPLNLNMLPTYPPVASPPIPTDPGNPRGNPHGNYGNKVAIPRLTPSHINRGRRRSARACEPCRQRKIKCDGARPTCGQCVYHQSQCSYEDVKRVRDQKELKLLGKRVERYEHLLRSLESEVEPHTARKIRKTLNSKGPISPSNLSEDSDSDSSAGSLKDIDNVNEDLNRDEDSRATGFFGKNSEVSWMQRLDHSVDLESAAASLSPTPPANSNLPRFPSRNSSHDVSIHIMNYHLDDLAIPPLDDSDPYIVPPRALADEYFNVYLAYIHPFFPAIRRTTFASQYRQFYEGPANPPRKWLGILNMVFAIGSHYCRLSNSDNSYGEDDAVYLARARKLVFDEDSLFSHPDLQQVQVELLMSVYLLCLGQVNRASRFSNLALHSAISLGINLRNTDGSIYDAAKEARSRLWWSVFTLEHLLTSMHGRASCVGDGLCSVPLPMPYEEETFNDPEIQRLLQDPSLRENQLRGVIFETQTQRKKPSSWILSCDPSPSLFFYYLVDLTLISQAILNKVYSIEGIREGTSQTEHRIQSYGWSLDRWKSKLTPSYDFTLPKAGPWHVNPNIDDDSVPYRRERVSLGMNYYSARIILCRPCLTQSPSSINSSPTPLNVQDNPQPSPRTKLRAEMANSCLQAACSLISIMPNTPHLPWISQSTPWWSVLHFLMQATTAILLGLSYCSFTTPPMTGSLATSSGTSSRSSSNTSSSLLRPLLEVDLGTMISHTKKAFSWIHAMAEVDPAARRAFLLCDNLVQKLAPSLKLDLEDWPSVDTLTGRDVEMEDRTSRLDELIDFEGGADDGYFDQ